jgi:DNA-binding response OmpR family regulator
MASVVLLIDDDPILGPVTIELLQAMGHKASWVESYESGVDTLSSPHDITIVLLDLQLGAQRGEALIDQLRSAGKNIPPVLIFSAQPMDELRQAANSIKASGILQKPCDATTINNAIKTAASANI